MHYILDGYNLLFRLINSRNDLELVRNRFISQLDKKAELLKLDITVVFDGRFQDGESTRSHYKNLEIIYSSHGETADELILAELELSPNIRREIVVTSDRDLAWRAKRMQAKTESSEQFYRWLNLRYEKKRLKKPPSKKQKTSPPPVPLSAPPPKDELMDHYLKQFEKRLIEEEKNFVPHKKKATKDEKAIDDFKRWLEIFEEKLHENHDE
jgi:uncharacterized protein